MAGFVKLWPGITESSLWDRSKEARLLFVALLAKADPTGFVEAVPGGLARLANLSREEVDRALEELTTPDPESEFGTDDGRRVEVIPGGYRILNYQAYRQRRDSVAHAEYMRGYMRDYRAGKRRS